MDTSAFRGSLAINNKYFIHMKFKFIFLVTMSFALLTTSCVRQPSSYTRHQPDRREYYSESENNYVDSYSRSQTKSTRASRAIHSATHDTSLPAKVQRLANQIERKFKSDSYTADDLERWANLYVEYAFEFSLYTQNLTDEQCESIEFNLGKIAGAVYKNGVVPVLNEIEKISEGIEDYEERSKKWEGAAERGFKSVAGDVDFDFDFCE